METPKNEVWKLAGSIADRISQTYTENDPGLQESVVEECMQFYLSISSDDTTKSHMFCKSQTSSTVISFLIVVLAGFDVDFDNEQFIPIRTCIDHCTDCLIQYHINRAKIRKNFILLKKVPYSSIQLTMEKPSVWEGKHLYKKISKSIEDKLDNESLKIVLSKILAECLLNPKILRLNHNLKTYFDHCTTFLNSAHNLLHERNMDYYPGLVYLLFSENPDQRNWALSKLPYGKLDDNGKPITDFMNNNDFNDLLVEEYEIHFFNIQKPDFFSDDNAIKFWTNIVPLVRFNSIDMIKSVVCEPYSSASFRDDSKIRIVPLYSIFINHVFSYLDSPLPFLLRFLAISLERLKTYIFELIKPHNYMSFFDMAFNNPAYKKYLIQLAPDVFPDSLSELDSARTAFFVDLVKWMEVCSQILNDSNNCQFSIAIFGFLTDYMKNPNCGKFIGTYVMENMNTQLTLKNNIYSENIFTEMTYKHSARMLVDKKCILLFDALNIPALENRAIKLIKTSLEYDIQSYAYYSHKLNNNQLLTVPDFHPDLWNLINVKIASNKNLSMNVFKSFEDLINVFLIDVPYKKTKLSIDKVSEETIKKTVLAANRHNKTVQNFTSSIENILVKLSEYLTSTQMKLILADEEASFGFWSLIMSPVDKIYDSSIALMNESFDVDDRLEAFKECLNLNLKTTLTSFKHALSKFTLLQLFLPSQRIVKVLMDFMTTLFDPMGGKLISLNNEVSVELKTSIIEFWSDVWSFLGMIFKNIFNWSITYEKLKLTLPKDISEKISSDLLNFTRDVLDLSHSVLNGLKIIIALLNFENSYKSKELLIIKETLLNPIIATLTDLFKWLRLSDAALLILCVDLITKILDLSTEAGIVFKDDNLTILIKLCLRAKKFNNKMNSEQTGELLLRARKMNDKLVDTITIQVEDEKMANKRSMSPDVKTGGYEYTSRKLASQSTLGNYLKPNIREVPSFVPPKRLSKLELAQQKLNEKRKLQSTSASVEPAPARPSGYNNSKKPIKIGSDSESDNEDSDNENTQTGGLFTKEQVVAKMKKTKAALQSLQAPRFHTDIGGKNERTEKQNALLKKKQAEELMRLRLNVDMNPLYKTILTWSYNNESELPSDYDESKYFPIKNKFDSVSDYQKSFEPLLLLECWQSIQRAKQIGDEQPFRMTIGSRSATDMFFDIYVSVKKEVINTARCFNDNDLLVIMLVDNLPSEEENVGIPKRLIKNATINCFAKVREIKNTNGPFCDITLRVSSENNNLVHKITSGMTLVGLKVNTMTTLEREFSSLEGLKYYDLSTEIIKAVPAEIEEPDSNKIRKIKNVYDVNDSQARAISGTVQGSGFSLIQGPPGTGKTKTILGVIGYFLTQEDKTVHRVLAPGVKDDGSRSTNLSSLKGDINNKRKILICAPSNAAVDELVLRIRKGIKNSKGEFFKPAVVRLGKSDAINEQVKDLTLEEQVDKQLTKMSNNNDDSKIREEHKKCIIERDELRKQLESGKLPEEEIGKTEVRLQEVMVRRRELGKRLDEMREQRAVNYRNREIERRNIQFKILNNAQVVCSTLSGSAHDVLAGMSMTFETVVIDEAAQCIELSAIIPLRYGCKKCIMVGDPNQLPPTVLSQKAASFNYEQSLFVRMQNNYKDSVYLLDVQYRMHPDISRFPSKEFYKSRLKDGPDMATKTAREWHVQPIYSPYRFFNLRGEQVRNERTQSLFNKVECRVILEIVEDLYFKFPNVNWLNKIGVISPYKEQVRLLRKTFIDRFGNLILKQVDFNTVDGFQGQEKDIIIFSCVRAETNAGVGFLADIRRMNVALTRARSSLWVVGSVDALVSNKTWRDLCQDAKDRQLITETYVGFTRKVTKVISDKDALKTVDEKKDRRGKIENLDSIDSSEKKDKKKKKESTKSGIITQSSDDKQSIKYLNSAPLGNSKKRQATGIEHIDVSKLRKISKHVQNVRPIPVKTSSGQISADLRMTKSSKITPSASGVIMPKKNIKDNTPAGMVKISKPKPSYMLPKAPKRD